MKPDSAADPTAIGRSVRRIAGVDGPALAAGIDACGWASLPRLLTPAQCRAVAALWDRDEIFRSTVDMARHRFGEGTYRYFAAPLPPLVAALREAFYPLLLPIARVHATRLGRPAPWPDTLREWLATCHAAGQKRPTPLLLRYGPGGWNALHRDLYGDLVFPLQVVIGLDEPGVDHTGGEFLLVEQRARAQSRGTAVIVEQGHAVVFPTRERPTPTARGWSASPVRHGASTVRTGVRRTLGLIFHDAE